MPDDTKGRQFTRRDYIAELGALLERERLERDEERARLEDDIQALIEIAGDAIDLLQHEGATEDAAELQARVDAVRAR